MSGPAERRIWETMLRQVRVALDAGKLDGVLPLAIVSDPVGGYHDDGIAPGQGVPTLLLPSSLPVGYVRERLAALLQGIAAGQMRPPERLGP